jgi:hypothetical protein
LKELAEKLNDDGVRTLLKTWFTDSEIKYLQEIFRNYPRYSAQEILSLTGVEKSNFPLLFHLWLEKARSRIVHLPVMHGSGGMELLEDLILSAREEARSEKRDIILLIEFPSLGSDFFESFLRREGLQISLMELLTDPTYREVLRRAFEIEQVVVLKMIREGTIVSLFQTDPFTFELFSFLATHRIHFEVESYDFSKDSDLEAKRLAMLAEYGFLEEIESAVFKGDVDSAIRYSQEFIDAVIQSQEIRDKNIAAKAAWFASPQRDVYIIMGAGHYPSIAARDLIPISRQESLPVYFTPLWKIISAKIRSQPVEDERKLLLQLFPLFVARHLMNKYKMYLPSEYQSDVEILRISAQVAERWKEEDCLGLAEALRSGEPQAQIYFISWIIKNGTEEEKAIFRY